MEKIDEVKSTIENSDGEVIFEFSTHISAKPGSNIHAKDIEQLLASHGRGLLTSTYQNLVNNGSA